MQSIKNQLSALPNFDFYAGHILSSLCSAGVGKLFSRRAALTILRVVEGQGLLSRTAACYRRNCIGSEFCEIFWQCGISARKIGGVSKKKVFTFS